MQYVVAKLTAMDPDAGAAVEVITQFDALVESGAGLASILVAAAVTTRCPARIVSPDRGVYLRVGSDGAVADVRDFPAADPTWLTAPLVTGGPPTLWLERSAHGHSLVDAMVLERTAFAVRSYLDRVEPGADASAERLAATWVLVDQASSPAHRFEAAATLGLSAKALVRAVATADADPRVEMVHQHVLGARKRCVPVRRTGVGPRVEIDDLPESWRQAKIALAFAADDTDRDPGNPVVYAEDLGVLGAIASHIELSAAHIADVGRLEEVRTASPSSLRTLDAFVSHASVRLAAASLFVHHSTFQKRITGLERQLNWRILEPDGKFRLQLALAIRRYLLHPVQS